MKSFFVRTTQTEALELIARYKAALRENHYRYAIRLHAVILNLDGRAAPEIASILKVHRSKVVLWLRRFQSAGCAGLVERARTGRPPRIKAVHLETLRGLLEKRPVDFGLKDAAWSLRTIAWVMAERFGIAAHPSHWSRLRKNIFDSPSTKKIQFREAA